MEKEKVSRDVEKVWEGYFGGVFLEDLSEEGKDYLKEQIDSLKEIEKLDGDVREYAYELLTVQDKETKEYKYSPSQVLDHVTDEGSFA